MAPAILKLIQCFSMLDEALWLSQLHEKTCVCLNGRLLFDVGAFFFFNDVILVHPLRKEIESSPFSHTSWLSLSVRLSFCFTLCHIGGRFYRALGDAPRQWCRTCRLCRNAGSAYQTAHTHVSRGFAPSPAAPSSSAQAATMHIK